MKRRNFILTGPLLCVVLIALGLLKANPLERPETQPKSSVHKTLAEGAGREVFETRCAACHGLDGRGGEHAPDIVANPRLHAASDQALSEIIRDGLPRRGMPAFNLSLTQAQIREVVRFLRSAGRGERQGGRQDDPGTSGNPQRGETLFFGKAGCGDCHMIGGKGGFLGEDLSHYGRDHLPGTIREAILSPNRNLSPDHGVVVATTRDGRQWVGMARNEDNFSLQLLDSQGRFQLLLKSDLAALRHEPKSLMPDDYATRLSMAELEDLVSYLARGK